MEGTYCIDDNKAKFLNSSNNWLTILRNKTRYNNAGTNRHYHEGISATWSFQTIAATVIAKSLTAVLFEIGHETMVTEAAVIMRPPPWHWRAVKHTQCGAHIPEYQYFSWRSLIYPLCSISLFYEIRNLVVNTPFENPWGGLVKQFWTYRLL